MGLLSLFLTLDVTAGVRATGSQSEVRGLAQMIGRRPPSDQKGFI